MKLCNQVGMETVVGMAKMATEILQCIRGTAQSVYNYIVRIEE